jgi:uncharacterized protein
LLYLTSDVLFTECLEIGLATGSMPPAIVRPRIDSETLVSLEPSTILPAGPMKLLLAEHTASWCLLTPFETDLARTATNCRLSDLNARYPRVAEDSLKEFLVRLYQRGLLRLNGRPGLDPELLREGAPYGEGYLVEVLVTQQCNLGCRYCLAEAGPDMPHLHPELAFEAVEAAFNLRADLPLTIQLSGGEPFVNLSLFKALVEQIEEKRRQTGRSVRLCTQSNGTLINDEIAEFLRDHEIGIGISCDGPNEFSDVSRPLLGGQPSLQRTLRGVETLRRHGVPFGVILVLNRANIGHVDRLLDFFVSIGVNSLKINPISMVGDAQLAWDSMAVTPDQYFAFLDTFVTSVLDRQIAFSESNLGEYLKYLTRRRHDYRCLRSNCGAGKSFFLVDAVGDVYPCAHSAGIPSWRLGSVGDAAGDLVSLGEKSNMVQRFRMRLVDQIDETKNCPWRHFCEGGCAVNAYQSFGTIQAADGMCAFYERFYPRLLERLAAEPDRFQSLLDITFGDGRASVVEFSLCQRADSGLPAGSAGPQALRHPR